MMHENEFPPPYNMKKHYGACFLHSGSHLSEVAVLRAGPCHLGGLCKVHREPAVVIVVNAPHIVGARQLIFFVGHAGVTATAYIGCSSVQLRAHLHQWTSLPLARRQSLRCAGTVRSVMHLKSAEREKKLKMDHMHEKNKTKTKNKAKKR